MMVGTRIHPAYLFLEAVECPPLGFLNGGAVLTELFRL